MKTKNETLLTPTQQTLIDHLEKFEDSPVDLIVTATGLNKLLVTNSLKILLEKKKLIQISDTTPPTYKLLKPDGKSSQSTEKKTKTAAVKKVANDEVSLKNDGRNTDKLKFDGELYGKGRLVLAVVKKYMADHPKTTLSKLKELFPDELQARYGMVQEYSRGKKLSTDRDRFFFKLEDCIKTGDNKKAVVCNQFGSNNIAAPLKHFKAMGYTIK